jgi:hypothetical protein
MNFDQCALQDSHNTDADCIKTFELEPIKYLGIKQISKIRLGLIHNFIIPYPCAFNTIAYYDLITKTTEYLTLNNTERLCKFFTFSKNNLIIVEKINEINISKLSFISKHNSNESDDSILLENGLSLIDLTVSSKLDNFALLAKDSNFFLNIWSFDLNDFNPIKLCEIKIVEKDSELNGISFYPNDNKRLIIYGNNFVSSYLHKNEGLSLIWKHTNNESFFSNYWLNPQKLLLGNNKGEVLVFSENAITKRIPVKNDLNSTDFNKMKVNQIVKAGTGFICLVDSKELIIIGIEKHEEFKINDIFKLNSNSSETLGFYFL